MHLLETNNSTLNLSDTNNSAVSYSNLSFIRQTIRIAEGDYKYFYPQARMYGNSKTNITSCYYCIVSSKNVYSANDIIKGTVTRWRKRWRRHSRSNNSNRRHSL